MVPDVIRGNESLRLYLGGSPEERPETLSAGLGAFLGRPRLPPTLLIHGSGDQLVPDHHSKHLAEGLSANGSGGCAGRIPFADHGFDIRAGGAGEQVARQALLRFLARNLRRDQAHPGFP